MRRGFTSRGCSGVGRVALLRAAHPGRSVGVVMTALAAGEHRPSDLRGEVGEEASQVDAHEGTRPAYRMRMLAVTFIPGSSVRPLASSMVTLTGMTWVTFWKLPPLLDCGNGENTPAAPFWIC